eukprot:gene16948-2427_t
MKQSPDYHALIADVKFALGRVSAREFPHVSVFASRAVPTEFTPALVALLQQCFAAGSRQWIRVFGRLPPHGRLAWLGSLVDTRPHPNHAFHAYDTDNDFDESIQRIIGWYAIQRSVFRDPSTRVTRSDVVMPDAHQPLATPIMNDAVRAKLMSFITPPMRQTVLAWGAIARRYRELSLELSSGTACVEGGIFTVKRAMFTPQQTVVTEQLFRIAARNAIMLLNYHLAHRHNVPVFAEQQTKMYDLMCAAGLMFRNIASNEIAEMQANFRRHVA